MTVPVERIENLVERCLDAGDQYRAELERLVAAHPEVAAELRHRIAQLEQLGFVGEGRSTSGNQWLPERVGGYRLEDLIGRGGMGVVFRGRKDGGEPVAIKLVRPDLLTNPRARERFRREALLVTRLSHPGICPVLEVGVDDDVPFLVMPLLVGRTFGEWMRAERPTRERVLAVLEGHARALHLAHEAGLVHRDVTVGNLFVTADDRPVVLDFGLARDTTGDVATMTMSQEQLGTLPYMAPEQLRGGTVDRRTDVYALGVVLYEALAGRLPFVARARSDVTRLILDGDAPRLGKVASGLPRALERVVQTAMDLDPARRYATAQELADDLARARRGEPVAAHGVGPWLRARRWVAHHPLAAVTMLLLSLLFAGSTAFIVHLSAIGRVQDATEQALLSRTLEQADPMRALACAIAAHQGAPSPATLGQLNRLLHQVNLLRTRTVLPGPVRALAVHRVDDAEDLVAVASEAGVTLLRLDRTSGAMREVRRIPALDECLPRCVRLSPTGRFVACGGTGKMACVAPVVGDGWRQLRGSSGEIVEIDVDDEGGVFGLDVRGRLLRWPGGSGDAGGEELLNLRERPIFPDHEPNLRGMKAGPGGDLLLWNMHYLLRVRRDGQVVWKREPIGSEERKAVATIDAARGRVLLVQQGAVRLLDWSTGAVQWEPRLPSPATDAAVAGDGVVASLHVDGALRFWDAEGGAITEYRDPQDHLGAIEAATEGGAFLAVGFGGTQVRLSTAGRVVRSMNGGDVERLGLPGPFAWSSDGSVLLAAGGPGQLRSWDFDGSRGADQARLVASPPVGLMSHPDRRRVLIPAHDQTVWSWLPGSHPESVGKLPFAFVSRNQVAPGEALLVGGRSGMTPRLAVFDEDSGRFRVPFRHGGQYAVVGAARLGPRHVLIALGDNRFAASKLQVFRSDGVAVAFERARCRSWDVPLEIGRLTCMDASADGRRLVLGCVAGGLHVFDLPDQAWDDPDADRPPEWKRKTSTNGRVWTVDMAGDGRFVVAGIQDGSVLGWELDGTASAQVLVEPRRRAARASLADDHRLVVEFAPDGLVRLLDANVAPAQVLFEAMVGDGAVVRDAALLRGSPDAMGGGQEARASWRLVTVSSDGWLRSWSLDERAVLDQARRRLRALEQD